jgi:hypothetical protein
MLATGGLWDVPVPVCLWNAENGTKMRELGRGASFLFSTVAFSPDGKLVSEAGDSNVTVWDRESGKELWALWGKKGTGGSVFSPDSKTLAYVGDDGSVRLVDVMQGKEKARWKDRKHWAKCVAFSKDGRTVASGGHGMTSLLLWEAATGKVRHRLAGPNASFNLVAFSPDDRTLATTTWRWEAIIWDATGVLANRLPPIDASTWDDLGSDDASRAYRAIWTLVFRGKQAPPFLRERVRPAVPVPVNRVQELIRQLDSDQFEVREQATKELEELGETAEGELRKALQAKPSLELRQRIEQLLEQRQQDALGPGLLRAVRALEVLEHIGSPEALELLRLVSQGAPEARLTREAQAALRRLAK